MAARSASCSCGQLRLTCEGEPVRVSICHCLTCQKRTGSVFSVQARFPAEAVTIEGEAAHWSRRGDSGASATFSFCPRCGATVFWDYSGAPGSLIVTVGAFADPAFPPPQVSVYEARQHPWTRSFERLELEHYA
ncbi:MAG TPA: GFA family protein [Caulobacteraceae bacterium]|nr:GFA family protein [Caulobacteraceae bacterium]